MRILHIDEQNGWGGGEQQASYLIAGLSARGHVCHLAGRPNRPFIEAEHGGQVAGKLALPLRGDFDLLSARRIAAYCRTHAIDLIHAHTGHAHMIACLARLFFRDPKVVASRRVSMTPSRNLFSRWKYTLPDRFVAISSAIRNVLLDYGVPPGKIRVVRSGVDMRRLDVAKQSRRDLGLPESGPLIGNTASLVPVKDHGTLLDAMHIVVRALPEAHLVIAGEGPMRDEIEQRIATLGIGQSVHLLGYRRDIPAILKNLDVFVLSSVQEGLGTSVLDAMCCRVPVVATAAGGIPEMVHDGETGLLVQPGDAPALAAALLRMLHDRELAQRVAQGAYRLAADEFSAEAMIEGNLNVYRELIPESHG